MTRVAGIDGYRRGWVAIVLADGRFVGADAAPRLGPLIAGLGELDTIGVDIPIGLPDAGFREADRLARTFVGPRWGSVFLTPPMPVWQAATIEEARSASVRLTGQSILSQTFALAPRVLEADALAQSDERIYEVHPEVSFRALAGEVLHYPKSSWAGFVHRRSLLAGASIELPADLGTAAVAGVDDVLDAAVAAWSADRIARGQALTLPDDRRARSSGLIWY